MIKKEDVKSIASKAMINIEQAEILHYENSLNKLMEDIKNVEHLVGDDKITISPIKHFNYFNEVDLVKSTCKKQILKNAPNIEDDYILVPRVIK